MYAHRSACETCRAASRLQQEIDCLPCLNPRILIDQRINCVLCFASPYFLTPRNLFNVARDISVVGIVALGEALVIIARGIDLSVGSTISLTAVLCAMTLRTRTTAARSRESGIDLFGVPRKLCEHEQRSASS